jgi:hypothetical protein
MIIATAPRYGPEMAEPRGWVGQPGMDEYVHGFGGDSWTIVDPNPSQDFPVLLLVLDLSDPRLAHFACGRLRWLPLCSFINSDGWGERQIYTISPQSQTIIATQHVMPRDFLDEVTKYEIPLPEKPVQLRAMTEDEYPTNEERYWRACDGFVGGNSFIRVSGPPLWLQWVQVESCECGKNMDYVAAIGYEGTVVFLEHRPFFIGEGALYFFLCQPCLKVSVICQDS